MTLPVGGSVANPVQRQPARRCGPRSPEAGLPALCVEVHNGTEDRPKVAAKLIKYVRFYQRTLATNG